MNAFQPLDPARVQGLVRSALEEDAAGSDATAAFLALGDAPARAEIRVSAPTVACGIDIAREVFRQVDPRLVFGGTIRDGARVAAGASLCAIEGPARAIVAAERTALNFLQRLCGVATLAARFVDAVGDTGVVILDTRKTTPLWRDLEKYAVRCGGAQNHRRDLGAMVLVKDNHVRAVGGRAVLLERILAAPRARFVEVEVDSIDFLRELLASRAAARVDRVMLDNFSPERAREALGLIAEFHGRGEKLEVEVSGGITLETVCAFAQPGVDFISVGALTHSAPAASMSLEIL